MERLSIAIPVVSVGLVADSLSIVVAQGIDGKEQVHGDDLLLFNLRRQVKNTSLELIPVASAIDFSDEWQGQLLQTKVAHSFKFFELTVKLFLEAEQELDET